MEFNTKYNHGDRVWIIVKNMTYKNVVCETCNNVGRVEINGKKFSCPSCYGNIKRIQDEEKWEVYDYQQTGIVGKINIESYSPEYIDRENFSLKVMYMLDSTGVGSGTMWKECDLFINQEDALLECDRRNKLLKE